MKSLLLFLFLTTAVMAITHITTITAITGITAISGVTAGVNSGVPTTTYECFAGYDLGASSKYKKEQGCAFCGSAEYKHYGFEWRRYKFCARSTSACSDEILDRELGQGKPDKPTLVRSGTCCCADNCNKDSIDASMICAFHRYVNCSKGFELAGFEMAAKCLMCGSAKITQSSGQTLIYKFCSMTSGCKDKQLDLFADTAASVEASCCCGLDDCNGDSVDNDDVAVCAKYLNTTTTTSTTTTSTTTSTTTTTTPTTTTLIPTTTSTTTTSSSTTISTTSTTMTDSTTTTTATTTTTTATTTTTPATTPAPNSNDKGAAEKKGCPAATAFLLTALSIFLFP